MKSFLQYLIEKDAVLPAILSASMAVSPGDTQSPQETPPSTASTTEKPEEKKTKTITAQEYAAANTERNGVLQSGDLVTP